MEKHNISNFKTRLRLTLTGLIYCFIFIIVIALTVLAYILLNSIDNPDELVIRFNILILINIILGVCLTLWVGILIWRFIHYMRSKKLGTQLTLKLTLSYIAMAVFPGLIIYFFSNHIMFRSVESWFNVKVDKALTSGLILGQSALDTQLDDYLTITKNIANRLSLTTEENVPETLNDIRRDNDNYDVLIFTPTQHRILAYSSTKLSTGIPAFPSNNIIEQTKLYGQYAEVEQIGTDTHESPRYQIRIITPIYITNSSLNAFLRYKTEPYYLQLTSPISLEFSNNMNAVQNGISDYKTLELSRNNILEIYFVSLRLFLTLMVVFSMIASLQLARRIVRPLSRLAEATHRVSQGQFLEIEHSESKDEIASLTNDFNHMIQEVKKAQEKIESQKKELMLSNTHLESILSTLSSGVLVFDQDFHVKSFNNGAKKVLGEEIAQTLGKPLQSVPIYKRLHDFIYVYFISNQHLDSNQRYWSAQFEPNQKNENLDNAQELVLLLKGSYLMVNQEKTGYLLVIEDISEVISANRTLAWKEVARRLAHEIKNPLTPIQLSIERLELKIQDKLEPSDAHILHKTTTTIINQVAALSAMVNDFRSLSQTKHLDLKPVNLNELIIEVARLYGYDDDPDLSIELEDNLPFIKADPSQIRQVLNNLLRNAQDAVQEMQTPPNPTEPLIQIKTSLIKVPHTEHSDTLHNTQAIQLQILDQGIGFKEEILHKIFEPYITTKAHGTGLGLSIVKKIIEEHGATIEVKNRAIRGARISILFKKLT